MTTVVSKMTSSIVLDAADPATTELVLQLQLTDLEEVRQRLPGKRKEGVLGDLDVALDWMEQHLRNMQQILADKRIARSMAGAVHLDHGIITSFTHEENAACQDRAYAVRLAGRPQEPEEATEEHEVDDTIIARLAGLYVSEAIGYDMLKSHLGDDTGIGETEPESSAWAAQREVEQDKLQRMCVVCMQIKQFFDLMPAPCTHEYCRTCLQDLFQSSFTDESLFPPRCCRQDIPLSRVAIFLNAELIGEYERKKVEFSTPNRTYCSRAICSSFIRPEEVDEDVGTCRKCFAQTCTICKMPAHDQMECPNDLALQAVDELAQQNGWQRCHACRRLVELEIGCNHMTYGTCP